jgi:hypothetical protein
MCIRRRREFELIIQKFIKRGPNQLSNLAFYVVVKIKSYAVYKLLCGSDLVKLL